MTCINDESPRLRVGWSQDGLRIREGKTRDNIKTLLGLGWDHDTMAVAGPRVLILSP